MKMAIAIVLLWLGSCLLWVASRGLGAGAQGVADVWRAVLNGIGGTQI